MESTERQLYLQLIILDRYDYDELSTRLMQSLRKSVLGRLYQSELRLHSMLVLLTLTQLYRPIKVLFSLRHSADARGEWSRPHTHFWHILPCDAVYDTDLRRLL